MTRETLKLQWRRQGRSEGQLTPSPEISVRDPSVVSETFREKAGKGGPFSRIRIGCVAPTTLEPWGRCPHNSGAVGAVPPQLFIGLGTVGGAVVVPKLGFAWWVTKEN